MFKSNSFLKFKMTSRYEDNFMSSLFFLDINKKLLIPRGTIYN